MKRDRSSAMHKQAVIKAATLHGWKHFHVHGSRRSQAGFPNLVLGRPPVLLFVELKTDKGRVRPEQREWIDLVNRCEMDAMVWRPRDWPRIEQILRTGHVRPGRVDRMNPRFPPLLSPPADATAATDTHPRSPGAARGRSAPAVAPTRAPWQAPARLYLAGFGGKFQRRPDVQRRLAGAAVGQPTRQHLAPAAVLMRPGDPLADDHAERLVAVDEQHQVRAVD